MECISTVYLNRRSTVITSSENKQSLDKKSSNTEESKYTQKTTILSTSGAKLSFEKICVVLSFFQPTPLWNCFNIICFFQIKYSFASICNIYLSGCFSTIKYYNIFIKFKFHIYYNSYFFSYAILVP